MPKAARTQARLSSGRPPLQGQKSRGSKILNSSHLVNPRRKSAKATRRLINTHHQLHKSRVTAIAAGDHALVSQIDEQIEQLGGIQAYQAASLTGQDKERGGDSSEKLVEWLSKHGLVNSQVSHKHVVGLRVLEIGALSDKNKISHMIGKGIMDVKRIDLHSQESETIQEIDFMDFPLPNCDQDMFDIISLSLVLNYVPSATQRGHMLRRTTQFLRHQPQSSKPTVESNLDRVKNLPLIFVVLPLPCLDNSRYMTHDHFNSIMESLGFELLQHHNSQKLTYMLFRLLSPQDTRETRRVVVKKTEINPGKSRNNFAIILEAT